MSSTQDRTSLPVPDPQHRGPVVFDARDPEAAFTPIEPLRPPRIALARQ